MLLAASVQIVISVKETPRTSLQAADSGIGALIGLRILRGMAGRCWGCRFQAREIMAVPEGSAPTEE